MENEIYIQANEFLKILGGGIIELPNNKWMIRNINNEKLKLNNIQDKLLKDKVYKSIQTLAYLKWKDNNRSEVENWLEAEREVLI